MTHAYHYLVHKHRIKGDIYRFFQEISYHLGLFTKNRERGSKQRKDYAHYKEDHNCQEWVSFRLPKTVGMSGYVLPENIVGEKMTMLSVCENGEAHDLHH